MPTAFGLLWSLSFFSGSVNDVIKRHLLSEFRCCHYFNWVILSNVLKCLQSFSDWKRSLLYSHRSVVSKRRYRSSSLSSYLFVRGSVSILRRSSDFPWRIFDVWMFRLLLAYFEACLFSAHRVWCNKTTPLVWISMLSLLQLSVNYQTYYRKSPIVFRLRKIYGVSSLQFVLKLQ